MTKNSLLYIIFIFVFSLLGNNISESVFYYVENDNSFDHPLTIPSTDFQHNNQSLIRLGFQTQTVWIRIPVSKSIKGAALLIDCSNFTNISCFIPDSTSEYHEISWDRIEENPLHNLFPSFQIPETLPQNASLYLKLESRFRMRFRIKSIEPEELQLYDKQNSFFIGVLLGTLLALLLYNIFISAYLFDKSYLLYVVFILLFMLYEISLTGIGAMFGISMVHAILPLTIAALLAAAFFSISYLQLKSYTKRGYWLMTHLIIPLGILFLILSIVAPSVIVSNYLNYYILFGITVIVLNGFVTARRGNRTARPYLTAWSILFLCGVVFIARGVLNLPHNIITQNLVLIGGSFSSMILSIGLAQHIKDIRRERETMTRREESLTEMAQTDALTGLYNKRYFEINVGAMLQNGATPLSLAVLDIDHFKKYNDTYGHLEGDTVLRVIGELLYDNIEEDDIPIRYGGEEFVLIMPQTPLEEAMKRCENIRQSTENLHFVLAKGTTSQVTISMGVAEALVDEGENQLFIRADKALYEAKESGRNCVISADNEL